MIMPKGAEPIFLTYGDMDCLERYFGRTILEMLGDDEPVVTAAELGEYAYQVGIFLKCLRIDVEKYHNSLNDLEDKK